MISVVIPLYNKEKSIKATLESVLKQTYTDWECIVINDGSSDNSLEVVKNFIDEFKIDDFRFQILSQQNSGVSAARNRGIMEAKGEYISFLDADDLWTPDYLETLVSLIRDYPDAGLYSIGYTAVQDNQIEGFHTERNYERERGIIDNPWTANKDFYCGSNCSSRRKRLIEAGMFDIRMTHGEDLDMWWRLVIDGGLVYDAKHCVLYRQDAENRAMRKIIPLEKHIPYYIDKFAKTRLKNIEFRRFFDEQMIYRLYPYLLKPEYKKEARVIAQKFDYSQLKWSMHFRMLFPYTYYCYKKLKNTQWSVDVNA